MLLGPIAKQGGVYRFVLTAYYKPLLQVRKTLVYDFTLFDVANKNTASETVFRHELDFHVAIKRCLRCLFLFFFFALSFCKNC